mmetsp:Transcript_16839/g.47052  ORF Transcript_16839/g.47052 Transcript_16839/m.47052 type:complete len:241 (+) Transcript_16839:2386-3108(+)
MGVVEAAHALEGVQVKGLAAHPLARLCPRRVSAVAVHLHHLQVLHGILGHLERGHHDNVVTKGLHLCQLCGGRHQALHAGGHTVPAAGRGPALGVEQLGRTHRAGARTTQSPRTGSVWPGGFRLDCRRWAKGLLMLGQERHLLGGKPLEVRGEHHGHMHRKARHALQLCDWPVLQDQAVLEGSDSHEGKVERALGAGNVGAPLGGVVGEAVELGVVLSDHLGCDGRIAHDRLAAAGLGIG